jgi:hypothetical protein
MSLTYITIRSASQPVVSGAYNKTLLTTSGLYDLACKALIGGYSVMLVITSPLSSDIASKPLFTACELPPELLSAVIAYANGWRKRSQSACLRVLVTGSC